MRHGPFGTACAVGFLILATLPLGGCEEEPSGPGEAGAAPVFDPALFKANIQSVLQQNNVDDIGYTFVINHLGVLADSAEVGFALMPQDGGVEHSIFKEMNIASVTKWLTAVGALDILKVDDVSLDQPVWTWFPKSWDIGAGVETITFRDLLTHTTGLTTDSIRYATDFKSLKKAIATPLANPAKGYNYSNVNFALFRILFPYMDHIGAASTSEYYWLVVEQDTAAFDQYLADTYVQLMQEYVYTPADVDNALMKPVTVDDVTRMYYRFNTTENGSATGDWTLVGGGGGYYLSARDIASVMAHVFHSDLILNSAQRVEMLDDLLGFDSSPSTDRGPAYQKDGALYRDTNGSGGFDNGDRGLQTLIMKFPGDVELVLFVNSLGNGWNSYVPMMVNAYEDAWVIP
jgi:D-alanyl-D-alanine carboxypeptidase